MESNFTFTVLNNEGSFNSENFPISKYGDTSKTRFSLFPNVKLNYAAISKLNNSAI